MYIKTPLFSLHQYISKIEMAREWFKQAISPWLVKDNFSHYLIYPSPFLQIRIEFAFKFSFDLSQAIEQLKSGVSLT